jgi:hypothetical protein
LKFVEVEIDNRLQGFGGGALLKTIGQGLKPGSLLVLKSEQGGNGLVPAPNPAAVIDRAAVMDHRPGCGAGGAMPGLSLGRGHWPVAKGLAGHEVNSKALRHGTGASSEPKFLLRLRPGRPEDQARCLKRQLSLPVSMMSQ